MKNGKNTNNGRYNTTMETKDRATRNTGAPEGQVPVEFTK
jgi:hypothetical protein